MYVLTIDCAHLGELAARAAYILILKVSRHCHSAPQHGKSWNMGLIGRGTVYMRPACPRRLGTVRLATPTKSRHQPKALRAGVDGRAQSCGKRRFIEFPCAKKS